VCAVQLVVLGLLAGSTSLVTIVGNMIVILSFIIERSIRQPTNYFIASLAVSDLLIGKYHRHTVPPSPIHCRKYPYIHRCSAVALVPPMSTMDVWRGIT